MLENWDSSAVKTLTGPTNSWYLCISGVLPFTSHGILNGTEPLLSSALTSLHLDAGSDVGEEKVCAGCGKGKTA